MKENPNESNAAQEVSRDRLKQEVKSFTCSTYQDRRNVHMYNWTKSDIETDQRMMDD